MNYDNPKLVVKHIPEPDGGPFESIQDAIAAGYDTLAPVTGIVLVGVELDGAFIPIQSEKASLVHDAIELAKKNAAANQAASADAQAGTPGSGIEQQTPPPEQQTPPPAG